MRWLITVLIAGLFACQGQEEATLPIPEAELPPILIDLHLAESAVQSVYGTTRDSLTELYYQQVCVIHDVERRDLDSTLARLRRDPERMLRVYNAMMERVTQMEARGRN